MRESKILTSYADKEPEITVLVRETRASRGAGRADAVAARAMCPHSGAHSTHSQHTHTSCAALRTHRLQGI